MKTLPRWSGNAENEFKIPDEALFTALISVCLIILALHSFQAHAYSKIRVSRLQIPPGIPSPAGL
jgi:hypothetical protein